MKILPGLVMSCALFALSACSGYSLQQLRYIEPSGSEFNQVLTWRYLDYAEEKARRHAWMDSARFADKGLLAAYDNEVGPEELSGYALPADKLPQLQKARESLLNALIDKNRKERPAVAADALFYFDCWVNEQSKETVNENDAAYCRSRFHDRIAELGDTSYEKVLREQGLLGPPVDTTSYIVFFEWGQSTVSEAGGKVIDEVIKTLEPQEKYEVILNGHSDTAGDAKYNLQLSKRRADAVQAKLVAGGVREDAISVFAFGESDPPVKTGDGVKKDANRRVEIFLGE